MANFTIALNVSTHSRPKAAAKSQSQKLTQKQGFNTQPPEGGCADKIAHDIAKSSVSTHSRPKAAAVGRNRKVRSFLCFNTQPPEGGCPYTFHKKAVDSLFQHTAARRRLQNGLISISKADLFQHTAARRRLLMAVLFTLMIWVVSTHSRPKAAAHNPNGTFCADDVSTHSRPKAAALTLSNDAQLACVSTHSRPKAAARGK